MSKAAKKPEPKGITAWSYSRYRDWFKCPAMAKYKHVDRIKEPGNAAMDRGSAVGLAAEKYIKGETRKLAPELQTYKALFNELRAQFKKRPSSMVVESTWAFTKDWDETRWDDWKNCWLRVKVDCGRLTDRTTMDVIDWKTGKFRQDEVESYMEQLELYALAGLVLNETVELVIPRLVYLDLGRIYPNGEDEPQVRYTRADIPKLKKTWDKRTRPMFADRKFAPRPNDKCRWCFYGQSGKANGGPGLCKF